MAGMFSSCCLVGLGKFESPVNSCVTCGGEEVAPIMKYMSSPFPTPHHTTKELFVNTPGRRQDTKKRESESVVSAAGYPVNHVQITPTFI
ncbi:hypothetical protein YDYSY3_21760 [Paenibacillus chitinolyticus]|nr:hypothetical protein YDYSY3_21760 [Paenibacillus chitinolyticus]